MLLHDPLADGKPKTCPIIPGRIKGDKELWYLLLRDPNTKKMLVSKQREYLLSLAGPVDGRSQWKLGSGFGRRGASRAAEFTILSVI